MIKKSMDKYLLVFFYNPTNPGYESIDETLNNDVEKFSDR